MRDEGFAWFGDEASRNNKALFIKPEELCVLKTDSVLFLVGLAFRWVIHEIHKKENIYTEKDVNLIFRASDRWSGDPQLPRI